MSDIYFKNCLTHIVLPHPVGPAITHVNGCFQATSILLTKALTLIHPLFIHTPTGPILTGPNGWNILVILYSASENSLPIEAPTFILTISASENSHILEAPSKNGGQIIPPILLVTKRAWLPINLLVFTNL